MSTEPSSAPRFVVATVAQGRGSVKDDVAQIAIDELNAAKCTLIRHVTVNRERPFIEQLVRHLADSNEADVVLLIGGVGLGPRDYTCEVVDDLADRRIEGFGEAFRRLLVQDLKVGATAVLARAAACISNKCLVVGLPRHPESIRLAMKELVIPIATTAVRVASGGGPVSVMW
jgi:molybdenum cofactor synthesis domain-containing protein